MSGRLAAEGCLSSAAACYCCGWPTPHRRLVAWSSATKFWSNSSLLMTCNEEEKIRR